MPKENILKKHILSIIPGVITLLLFSMFISSPSQGADDSICAWVKIEIQQELTLERQAFDAHMAINNGLANITLENVQIDVTFSDQDGNAILASTDPNNLLSGGRPNVDNGPTIKPCFKI